MVCPEQITLADALRVSCNTAFARLGVDQLGADNVKQAAQAFGFESVPEIERDQDKQKVAREKKDAADEAAEKADTPPTQTP